MFRNCTFSSAAAASFPPAISTSSAAAHRAAHIAQPPRAATVSDTGLERIRSVARAAAPPPRVLLLLSVPVLSNELYSVWERLFCRQLRAKAGRSGALRSASSWSGP